MLPQFDCRFAQSGIFSDNERVGPLFVCFVCQNQRQPVQDAGLRTITAQFLTHTNSIPMSRKYCCGVGSSRSGATDNGDSCLPSSVVSLGIFPSRNKTCAPIALIICLTSRNRSSIAAWVLSQSSKVSFLFCFHLPFLRCTSLFVLHIVLHLHNSMTSAVIMTRLQT